MCVLYWAFDVTVSCSFLFVILSELYRDIGGNYLGNISFSDRVLVPSTDENSFDLDSGNTALHFRANFAHKIHASCRKVSVTASCYFPLVAICQLFSIKAKNKI
jgi:hypothetical protein